MLVIGSGSWGTALASQLSRVGHSVTLLGNQSQLLNEILCQQTNNKYLPGLQLPRIERVAVDLQSALEDMPAAIVIAVPSQAFKGAVVNLAKALTHLRQLDSEKKMGIIWATKGLSQEGQFLHQIIAEHLPGYQNTAVLSGPSFAKEVVLNHPTALILAGSHPEFTQKAAAYFQQPLFKVYLSQDILGVEIGGIAKNIYAMGAGLVEGLGYGANTVMACLTRALAEMLQLVKQLNAQAETIMGLSGCGDLFLTATSNQSRNKRLGLYIGQGLSVATALQKIGQVVEGLDNLEAYYRIAQSLQLKLPLLSEIYAILKLNKEPKTAIESLFDPVLEPEFQSVF